MWNPFRARKQLEFASDINMERLSVLADDFYRKILLPDEEPAFVSDEATIFDVSLAPVDELLEKIEAVYGKSLSIEELRKPFWRLLLKLNNRDADGEDRSAWSGK